MRYDETEVGADCDISRSDVCPGPGDGTRGNLAQYSERLRKSKGDISKGINMKGHMKLFVLQMNPDKSKQMKDAARSKNDSFGLKLGEAPSLQRMALAVPPLVVSARQ